MFGSVYFWILVLSALIAVGIASFYWYIYRNSDYWSKRGVTCVPQLGIIKLAQVLKENAVHEIHQDYHKKYGKLYGSVGFGKPNLTVADPELLKDILVKDFNVFNYRVESKSGDPTTDCMVTVLKGEDWKRVRTIITPAFTSRRMKTVGSIMDTCAKALLDTFEKHSIRGDPLDCKRIFGAYTMDVIASSAFATKLDSLNDPNNEFVKRVRDMFLQPSMIRILLFLVMPTWIVRKFRLLGFDTIDFFKDVTIEVIKERKQKGERYNDFLQLMMDAMDEDNKSSNMKIVEDEVDQFGSVSQHLSTAALKYKNLSEDEVLAQCIIFFIVGYETTAATLAFMAYALATSPECQEKLIAEVDETFQKQGNWSYDTVRDMKLLDAVLAETLRMYPPAVLIMRTADEDYQLAGTGITIEKDSTVTVPVYAMHHDPEFFEDPQKFDPNRFLEGAKHPSYAYLPFGAGPRNCLGMRFAIMEIKICICNILKEYKFKIAPETAIPLKFKKGMAFLSVEEISLGIEKRK